MNGAKPPRFSGHSIEFFLIFRRVRKILNGLWKRDMMTLLQRTTFDTSMKLLTLIVGLCSLKSLAAADSGGGKPNVVMIVADDAGWGDFSCSGNTNVSTPHVDSIGRAGAVLDRFYVCSVCAPTRAEMLTGRYHSRGGVRGVSTGQERLNADE
jgi:hypothetical protein